MRNCETTELVCIQPAGVKRKYWLTSSAEAEMSSAHKCSVLPTDTDEAVSTTQSWFYTISNNAKLEKIWFMKKTKNSILVVSDLKLALFQMGE